MSVLSLIDVGSMSDLYWVWVGCVTSVIIDGMGGSRRAPPLALKYRWLERANFGISIRKRIFQIFPVIIIIFKS